MIHGINFIFHTDKFAEEVKFDRFVFAKTIEFLGEHVMSAVVWIRRVEQMLR